VDARADVYAFGILIYQMLTGELPFKNANPGALILAHLQQPAPDPRILAPSLSEGTAHAIRQALAKQPTNRLPSAGALAAAMI
jgi:serine/threonine protein kinase